MPAVYFDNAATTKPLDISLEKFLEINNIYYANPSSLHRMGFEAESAMNEARAIIASSICAAPGEIYFTSGGTESNNIAILSAANKLARRGKHIICSAVEHPSVRETMLHLKDQGFELDEIPSPLGQFDINEFEKKLRPDTILVSLMYVNNELGTIFPLEKIAEIIRKKKSIALFHIDAVQAYLKIPLNVATLSCNMMSLSAHKVHAPKGVGALYIKKGLSLKSPVFGGGQENSMRSGTQNVAGICAFSKSCDAQIGSIKEHSQYVSALKAHLLEGLEKIDGVTINSPDNALPHIVNFCVPGYLSEVMLHYFEEHNIYISNASACSSKKKDVPVLFRAGFKKQIYESALRISLSYQNTKEEINFFLKTLSNMKDVLVKKEKL